MLTPGLYVLPDYRASEKLRILTCGLLAGGTRFRVPQDDEMFTRDAEVLAWIREDALGARTVTARCLLQFDRAPAKHNLEYEGKRSSRRLGPPALKLVRPGTYTALRQRRVAEGAPEAQVKIPHLSPDMNFGAEFEMIAEHRLQVTAR
jgi:hypothetical protein